MNKDLKPGFELGAQFNGVKDTVIKGKVDDKKALSLSYKNTGLFNNISLSGAVKVDLNDFKLASFGFSKEFNL